jgi:hypothetical protein
MILWHVSMSSAPGQPGYLKPKQHNLIKPDTAVGNANKNWKGGTSLWDAKQTSSKHTASCRNCMRG